MNKEKELLVKVKDKIDTCLGYFNSTASNVDCSQAADFFYNCLVWCSNELNGVKDE